eukprot:tig00020944_g16353.t1
MGPALVESVQGHLDVPCPFVGLDGYVECAPGWVPDNALSYCEPCVAGTYQVNDTCELCPVNTITSAAGLDACSECPPGTVSAADSQSCIPCPSGTFRNGSMLACAVVPTGSIALQSSWFFTVCPRGTVSNSPGDECVPCGKGRFEVDRVCRPCAGNTHNPNATATECIECAPGTVTSADRQTCQACLPGQYRSEGMVECAACPWGTYSIGGAPACTQCPPGTVSSEDRTSCDACEPGFYERNRTCLECPTNFVTPQPGATSCQPCEPGYISSLDRQNCLGLWAPPKTYGECLECPQGYYASPDSTYCIPCEPGQFMRNGSAVCEACPANTFTDVPGQTSCKACLPACPAGHVADANRVACLPCDAGASALSPPFPSAHVN